MTRTRRSSSSERAARGAAAALFALAGLAAACGAPPPAQSPEEPPKRKPDGVLLEPAPAVPAAVERGEARGVIALKPGLSTDEIRGVVRQLMRAFENEQVEAVRMMLTSDATDLVSHGSRDQIISGIASRFSKHRGNYQKLRGLEVAHVDRAEVREYDDLLTTGARPRPPDMAPGDVLVRVPMTAPMSNGERLFDDVLVLMLRRDKGQLKIAGYGETGS